MKVRYRGRALADLDEIFHYIDKRSPSGARNVIDEIHAAINAIAEYPLSAQQTSYPRIHVKIVRRYRYRIFPLSKPTRSKSCMCATARGVRGLRKSDVLTRSINPH
jgi:plasmid stabilization system protein ParE